MQVLELLIFAVLAAVVLYQLYAVLGRRVGRQPEDKPDTGAMTRGQPLESTVAQRLPADSPALGGMAAIKAKDQAFDVDKFLAGARSAFEVIVPAFAKGDREALRPLLASHVYESFEAAISQREAEGRSETIDFLQPPRADIEESAVDGDTARIKIRFLAEFRNRSKGPEGEAVDDRRTAEMWTFERPLASRDPNWILARVEAAQA